MHRAPASRDPAVALNATPDPAMRITRGLGRLMFAARWLMAPIYIGLLFTLVLLVGKFIQKLVALVATLWGLPINGIVLAVLSLIDLTLVANLVLIVVLSGWQSFVAPLLSTSQDTNPGWIALDFSAVKLKLIGALATIAAVEMLVAFMHMQPADLPIIAWQLAILLSLGLLGVLLALMDRLSHRSKE